MCSEKTDWKELVILDSSSSSVRSLCRGASFNGAARASAAERTAAQSRENCHVTDQHVFRLCFKINLPKRRLDINQVNPGKNIVWFVFIWCKKQACSLMKHIPEVINQNHSSGQQKRTFSFTCVYLLLFWKRKRLWPHSKDLRWLNLLRLCSPKGSRIHKEKLLVQTQAANPDELICSCL